MNDLISRQDAIEEVARRDTTDGTVKVYSGRKVIEILQALPSAQPEVLACGSGELDAQSEHKLLKIIKDFKGMTGCEDVLVVQKDAMKAWDENGVAYTMQPERKKGEWCHQNDDYYNWYECSECGYGSEGEMVMSREFDVRTNFCPNCGAKMEVEHETD